MHALHIIQYTYVYTHQVDKSLALSAVSICTIT